MIRACWAIARDDWWRPGHDRYWFARLHRVCGALDSMGDEF